MQAPRTVVLAGLVARFQLDDGLLAQAVTDNLGDCPRIDAPAQIVITDGPGSGPSPPGAPDEEHLAVRLWRRGGDLFIAWGDVASARVHDGGIHLSRSASASAADDITRAVRQMLPYALGHLLGAHDRTVLHAGAVLVDGAAVLVIGPTGAGKSTLVFAARSAGWPVLADDLVVVTPRHEAVDVVGIPRPLAIAAPGPHGLPPGARAIDGDLRQRWQFPLEGVSGSHPVAAVALVEHSAEPEGALEPMSASNVWDAVLGSFVSASDPSRLRAAFPVLAAVSRLPGWRLGHGADPDTRLAAGVRLLDSIADECRV